jgi:hypothetical protein
MTLTPAQVRVQHRKFSPTDRMNVERVKLGRLSGRKNAEEAKREFF